ncbi:hypothetical protein IEQ34_010901 [Dendrobium chrysotoxum]|uniref:Ubiquitin-like protease family profile domain-containing protein n=1 Tax=Dendrobium chrysotoxum TaxID=161865 RepID=A0AAV7GWY1_DENCH|nr:hypothetical protein IEQ34_010901 [Dendrobium chrysotoxum]
MFLVEHFPTTYTAFQMGNYSDSTSRTISEHNVFRPKAANTLEDVTHPKSAEEAHEVVDNASNEITKQEGQQDVVATGELAASGLIAANEITKLEALQEVLDIAKEINKPEDQQDFTEIAAKEITNPEEAPNVVDIAVKELTKLEEEEDMGFASSSHTGIARRVQHRVTTPNIEVDTNKGTTEKVPPKSLDIIEVGTESKIEARPAETAPEYCGRTGYKAYNAETKGFVSHINKESVSAANLILVPIIENSHWTLLVGNLKTKVWDFYDSLPKKTHRAILPKVVSTILKLIKRNYNGILLNSWHLQISHLYEDTTNSFDTDIRGWQIQKIKQAPTQKNIVDCGMYVCKYMKLPSNQKQSYGLM